jgi:hypothetical protein
VLSLLKGSETQGGQGDESLVLLSIYTLRSVQRVHGEAGFDPLASDPAT